METCPGQCGIFVNHCKMTLIDGKMSTRHEKKKKVMHSGELVRQLGREAGGKY